MKELVPALRLQPRCSLWLAASLLIAHTGALALITFVPLPVWVKLVLAGLISISLVTSLNNYALLRGRRAIISAIWDSDNQWSLLNGAGREYDVKLLPGSYVNTALVILNFSSGSRWRYRSMVLMPDSLAAVTLRRLRVRLLHPSAPEPDNNSAA